MLVRCADVHAVYSDESCSGPDLTYVVPMGNGLVACAGCADANNHSTAVGKAEADAILSRCAALVPALAGAPVLGTWAGIRPVRVNGVRLELQTPAAGGGAAAGPAVVHNYGHGGSGVVLSWGCAADVAQLAQRVAAGEGLRLERRPLPQAAMGLQPLVGATSKL